MQKPILLCSIQFRFRKRFYKKKIFSLFE